jgi:hypothetical protein
LTIDGGQKKDIAFVQLRCVSGIEQLENICRAVPLDAFSGAAQGNFCYQRRDNLVARRPRPLNESKITRL